MHAFEKQFDKRGRHTHTHKERNKEAETEKFSIHWFTPHMLKTAKAEPPQSQKQQLSLGLPFMWVARTQIFVHHSCLPGTLAGSWVINRGRS